MLAVICGAGDLPAAVAEARGGALVCVLDGFAPSGLTPDLEFRLETLGSLIDALQRRGVSEVCFCGHISRPAFDPAKLNAMTRPLAPMFQKALSLGDDGALRIVLQIFAEAGFQILAAHDAAPRLLPEAGVLTLAQPDAAAEARLGDRVLAEMGKADQGQACVLRGEQVLAREGADGTDAMLRRLSGDDGHLDAVSGLMDLGGSVLGAAADWLSGQSAGRPVLFKAPKPGQDRRADLPVIGPRTVAEAARAGLGGIIIEAGGVMVLHREKVVAACNAAGLFLWVRERPL